MSDPPSARRQRMDPRARREQLLDVTAGVVLDEGLDAVNIDRVARTAGVARTVVYSQFGSLDGLLLALVQRTRTRLVESVMGGIPPLEGHPDEVLQGALQAVLEAAAQDPTTWRLALAGLGRLRGAAGEQLAAIRTEVYDFVRPLLAWGLEQRGTPDVDVDLFTRSVIAAMQGAIRLMLSDPETYPLSRVDAYLRDLIGLLARR